MNDDELAKALLELQQAVITQESNWRGNTLLVVLKRTRHSITRQKKIPSNNDLAPLNP
ncbi:MAG: hypothetical protein GY732_19320 [Gammaproteobacteria bacterium]|nr:hypothetical protein [Gammaproteobacteria bacterium]